MTGIIIGWALFCLCIGIAIGACLHDDKTEKWQREAFHRGYTEGRARGERVSRRTFDHIDELRDTVEYYRAREQNRRIMEETNAVMQRTPDSNRI